MTRPATKHPSVSRFPTAEPIAPSPSNEPLLGAWVGSAAPVFCRNHAGDILALNHAFQRKLGLAATGDVGLHVTEFIHADDRPALAQAAEHVLQPPHRAVWESRWMTPQGWRWIAWEEHLLPGEFNAIRAVGIDITRQRMAEEQYYKLSRAVEQSPVGMVITDAQGNARYVNEKFIEATGWTLEHIIENQIAVLRGFHADEASYHQFLETLRAGRKWQGEHITKLPDGRKTWESVQVSALRNSAGEVTDFLCLREDLTERRELEEQLRQAQKMESLGTLAGGIAHDFNNMLAVVSGFAELAMLQPGLDPTFTKYLHEIRNATHRASGLVRRILTFSRKADVKFTSVDCNQLVRDTAALLGETFPRNITFSLALDEHLPPLHADQNQLQQVVLNLCVNARDAMPAGGRLSIATARAAAAELPSGLRADRVYTRLTVTDTGTGIPPAVAARVFEPFFTTKSASQGTGLGLAVVYGIVSGHEGAIALDSQPGEGTSFRIYLPIATTAATTPGVARAGDFPGGSESILIADDEPALRALLQSALAFKGYKVGVAADGSDAITQLLQPGNNYAALVLDFNMPGMNGLDVTKTIQAGRPDLKILLLTGHLTPENRAAFEQLGVHYFVTKPYALDELGRQLRRLLDTSPP